MPSGQTSPTPEPQTSLGRPVDIARVARAVARWRRWLALALVVGALAGGAVAKLLIERQYTSQAVLIWEPTEEQAEDVPTERALRTLIDSVELPDNLAEVRQKLELEMPLGELGRQVRVVSAEDSDLVLVEVDWGDPVQAARVANTLVSIFLGRRRTLERARRLERVAELNVTLAQARTDLADARAAYDELRRLHGIADLAVETRVAIEHVARLRSDADAASATAASQRAVNERLSLAAAQEPETLLLTEQETRPALLRLADTRAELEGARARLTDDHPDVQRLAAQARALAEIAQLEDSRVSAQQTVGRNPQLDALLQSAMRADAMRVANEEQDESLRRMARRATGRVQELVSLEGAMAELVSTLSVRERLMESAAAALAHAEDAARTPRAGFRSIAEATPPVRPRASSRRAVLVATPLATFALALLLLVAWEVVRLRPSSCEEVAYWSKAPVVAATPWPQEPRALGEFIADVDALEARGDGGTLLLAFSEEEEGLAPTIATALAAARHDDPSRRGTAVHFRHGGAVDSGARREARVAARVLVLVESGAHSARALRTFRRLLGDEPELGILLVGVGADLAHLPDRVGDVAALWRPDRLTVADTQPARTS